MGTEVLRFTVTTSTGGTEVCDLGADVAINGDDLSAEFSRQASLLAWWGTLLENSQHALRRAESEFDTFVADTSTTIRNRPDAKMTEGKVDNALKSDPTWAVRKRQLDDLRHQSELLKVAVKAIEAKGSMLISLGAHKRAEMDMAGLRLFGPQKG